MTTVPHPSRPRLPAIALACVALTASLSAQREATTLHALTERADAVFVARVLAVREQGDRLRATLGVQRTLRGRPPGVVELSEPAGRACGRALHGLLPGAGYLAFCVVSPRGEHGLAASSPRALVPLAPGLVEHVAGLITRTGAGEAELLVAALESNDRRIAGDAAAALARHPALPALPAEHRATLLRALRHEVAAETPAAPCLLTVTARLGLVEALDDLLPIWLHGEHPSLERPLRATLLAFDPAITAARLAALAPPDAAAALRAVDLAAALPDRHGRRVLESALHAPSVAVRRRAATALARSGASVAELAPIVGLDLARRATEAAGPELPRFRSITPRGQQ